MLKIHSSLNIMEIHNLKNVLETSGIRCEVRGEYRRAVIGELPVGDSFVELWLVDDDQAEQARRVLAAAMPRSSGPWTCPQCGESVEAEFDRCWSCQTDRPGDTG